MSWIQWATENMVNGVPRDALIDRMKQEGMPMVYVMEVLDCANNKISEQYQKLCSVVGNIQKLQEQDPDYTTVEKINFPSEDVFFKEYWTKNKPVVIKDFAKAWPAISKWSFDYFADNYGDELVEVQTKRESDSDYELNSIAHKTKMPLREFVAKIKSVDSSNDFYMTANNQAFKDTKLGGLLSDIGRVPSCLTEPRADGTTQLWMGPKGTVTPLHHDEIAIMHAQIVGRKKWKLISPFNTPNLYNHKAVFSQVDLENINYDRFPKMLDVKILEVVVEPEEALFIPIMWWHNVVSLDRSISVQFYNFKYPNHWEYNNPTGAYQ